jgi:hypothetical protein
MVLERRRPGYCVVRDYDLAAGAKAPSTAATITVRGKSP